MKLLTIPSFLPNLYNRFVQQSSPIKEDAFLLKKRARSLKFGLNRNPVILKLNIVSHVNYSYIIFRLSTLYPLARAWKINCDFCGEVFAKNNVPSLPFTSI